MKFKKFKFKKVKSTNNTAIRIIKETNYNLGMVIAETQTNGRGQYGSKRSLITAQFLFDSIQESKRNL